MLYKWRWLQLTPSYILSNPFCENVFLTTRWFLSFSNTEMDEDVELESAMLSITPSKLQVLCKYNFPSVINWLCSDLFSLKCFSNVFNVLCVLPPPAPPSLFSAAKQWRSMEKEKVFCALGLALEHSSVELWDKMISRTEHKSLCSQCSGLDPLTMLLQVCYMLGFVVFFYSKVTL